MLYRKIKHKIIDYLQSNNEAVLLVDGARQVGKTFIIREACKSIYKNFIEINMVEDSLGDSLFSTVKTVQDFYMQVSVLYGANLGTKDNTIIFLDEIQQYPHLLTLLKFLRDDNKCTFIASGSLLGVTLAQTTSIPIGSIKKINMFPLDFEEFLIANGMNDFAINELKNSFINDKNLDEATHNKLMDLFKKYLIVGGMPAVVNEFVNSYNIKNVRDMQAEIHEYYGIDASKYDEQNKLKIKTVYDYIPSAMENKKKRVQVNKIEDKSNATYNLYRDEFDYLINAGIVNGVSAISNPKFPLNETQTKNLIKLYLNDVGLLTNLLYKYNINAIMSDDKSINLGSVYETVVASELAAHNHSLYYYDNRKNGEVDFIINNYDTLSAMPIEVKSGKDYYVHSALSAFSKNKDYNCKIAYVLSNNREIKTKGIIKYAPIYFVMFM